MKLFTKLLPIPALTDLDHTMVDARWRAAVARLEYFRGSWKSSRYAAKHEVFLNFMYEQARKYQAEKKRLSPTVLAEMIELHWEDLEKLRQATYAEVIREESK